MRTFILAGVALVVAAGCGSTSDGGVGGPGATQFNLKITTAGNGLVRGAGADCRGNCTAQMTSGAQVHLVAVADSGASFVGWAGACSGTAGCDFTLDADREVSATFAAGNPPPPPPPSQRRLTVIVQGKGRVTSSPAGLDCDSSQCSADFAAGTSVTLTPTAASGFTFAGWGTDCSGPGGCSLTLSKDSTVYANFLGQPPPPPPPAQVHLVVSTSGPGTVTGGGLNCGESSSTCDVTASGGSSVTLTATAAGGARFTGWGGACGGTSTTCQLTLQSDTRLSAEFQSEVMALVTNDGTNGLVLALNSTHLFWPRYTNGNAIWSIPKKGGDAVRVAGGYATSIVADDNYLYWTDGSSIYSTPVGGGQVALLFTGTGIGKLVLDELGALYWTVFDGGSGAIHRMQDRADAVLASGQAPGSIAVDAVHVYFGDTTNGVGSIRRVPRKGGSVGTVLSCGNGCYVQALRLDPANIYFRATYSTSDRPAGQVQVVSKSDFKVRTIANNGPGNYQYAMEVDVNASVVYWNWTGGAAPYGIFRANADGSGFRAVDTSNDSSWYGLRVDDTAMYYWRAGAIIRRLK
jgi:hypothetical protein